MRACSRVAAAVALVAVGAFFAATRPAGAESFGFHISRYVIDMAIKDDGRVDVQEVLDVDFATEAHHGIFRTIQVRFDYEPKPKFERVYEISDVHVRATSVSAHNAISDQGRMKVFKIGDADHEVTGRHTYTISYTMRGTLNSFRDHDEFYWNAIGLEWEIPIDNAEIRVTAPRGMRDVRCFTGPFGSAAA